MEQFKSVFFLLVKQREKVHGNIGKKYIKKCLFEIFTFILPLHQHITLNQRARKVLTV